MPTLRVLGLLALTLLVLGLAPPSPQPEPLPGSGEPQQVEVSRWAASYFNNPFLNGNPVHTREDDCIKFNWGTGSPAPSVPSDNFSARWVKRQPFDHGIYRFHIITDDGARFWIDPDVNRYTIIDAWRDQPPTEYTADIELQTGTNTLKVEYYEHIGGAQINFWWERIDGDYPNWKGEYFKFYRDDGPCGGPVLTRNDVAINFDWGTGSPDPRLGTDFWAARWTGTPTFVGGFYRFFTRTDDGVRLWVDLNRDADFDDPGELIIDKWINQSVTTWTGDVYLSPGPHRVRMEYYELVGNAVAKLWWRSW